MGANQESLTISGVAHAAGVNVETVRFYQRKGLLREPSRAGTGIRRYRQADVLRLQFIRSARDSVLVWRKSANSCDSKTAPIVSRPCRWQSESSRKCTQSSPTSRDWNVHLPSSCARAEPARERSPAP